MKNSSGIVVGLVCAAMLSLPLRGATNVAAARTAGPNAYVEIGPIVVSVTNDLTASGYVFCAQDDSGGVSLHWPAALVQTARQIIAVNSLRPGSIITVHGTNAWYQNLYELTYISAVISNGVGPAPIPIDIDIKDLQTGAPTGTICQSMLVRISGVTFPNDAGNMFASGVNYKIRKDGTNADVRLQDPSDPLVGTTIPSGVCTIEGILSQFAATFQLFPLKITPVTPQDDPDAKVVTNFVFGVVYPGQTRTLQYSIKNGGSYTNLVVTGLTADSGDTAKFTLPGAVFPITLAPQSNVTIAIRYEGGSTPGEVHNGVFLLNSNDSSTPDLPVTLRGAVAATPLAPVWINEVDYDSPDNPDNEEFVELCGPAGTDITGWQLEFYNGNPSQLSNYFTFVIGSSLGGSIVLGDQTNGYGFYVLRNQYSTVPYTEQALFEGIENGAPDAIRLVSSNGVQAHFFEYEASSASTYPSVPPPSWPDDLTPLEDPPNSESKSLSLQPGFARTNLAWVVANHTPLALNTTNNSYVAKPGIVINEIMYNPPESGIDVTEYIELYNSSAGAIDLQGYYFSLGIRYTQTTSYVLGPGEYCVIAAIASNLYAYNPTTTNVAGEYTTNDFNGLSNSGETLTLRDNIGRFVDTVTYGVAPPWPTNANGGGSSLELTDWLLDNNDPASWAASVNEPISGTPGYENSTLVPEPVSACMLLALVMLRRCKRR